MIANGSLERVTDEILGGRVIDHGFEAAAAYGVDADALAAYRAEYPIAGPGELLAAIETDWWCRIPALRLAEAHCPATAGTYMYEFAWPAPVGPVGACHALEIGFVFDTLDLGPNQMLGPMLYGAAAGARRRDPRRLGRLRGDRGPRLAAVRP